MHTVDPCRAFHPLEPPSPSVQASVDLFIPQSVLMSEIAPTEVQHLYLQLLNPKNFLWAHFSSLSRSLWMASQPSVELTTLLSFMSNANLLRVHLIKAVSVIDKDLEGHQYSSAKTEP